MKEKTKSKETLFSFIKGQSGLIIVLLIALVGLIFLILPEGKMNKTTINESERIYSYAEKLEENLIDLCSCIKGVSAVKVSVYFDSGFETVYAYNEESKSTSNGINSEKKYVTVGSGNDESMVCLFEKMPNICGVAVVCNGGGNPVVANEIINMISSAFGVPKSKIYVTEGKN